MSQTDKRLEQLGIELPKKDRRGKGVVAVRQCGDLLFVSGHGPTDQRLRRHSRLHRKARCGSLRRTGVSGCTAVRDQPSGRHP